MENQLVSLSKIFTERLFRIPDYQRGYAWTEKQLKDFWTDLEQLEPGRNHYTGVLTLENVSEENYGKWNDDLWIIKAKSYAPYFVVDGQQRLTTSIILIQVILDSIKDGQKLNYTTKSDIQRKFIFDYKETEISRSYIFGYVKDNPSYNFLKSKIFGEHVSDEIEETAYTQNLENAKKFFEISIKNLNQDGLEILYRKVTQNLLFNVFTISSEVDTCVAFETMNNRGKLLTYLELLKNRLIYLSLKVDEPEHERNALRSAINDCWKAVYHNLGKNKDKPLDDDRFLQTHYNIYFSNKNDGKDSPILIDVVNDGDKVYYRRMANPTYAISLLEHVFVTKNVSASAPEKSRITLQDIYKYVRSLEDSIKTWFKMFNPSESEYGKETKYWLDKLNRIGFDYYAPIVLVFFQKIPLDQKRVSFLKALERHIFVLSLLERYYSFAVRRSIDSISISSDLYNSKTDADKIIRQISDETINLMKDELFEKAVVAKFRQNGFYIWSGIKYFLFEYDLYLREKSKTEREKIQWMEYVSPQSDYHTVEHIYPQRPKDEYWISRFQEFPAKQKNLLRNSLGNLLPLSKPKNASLSNRSFPEKIDGKHGGAIGYRYGCFAENEVSKYEEWNAEKIYERGMMLLSFMEERWSINIGDDRMKANMLGIEFMTKKEGILKNVSVEKKGKLHQKKIAKHEI